MKLYKPKLLLTTVILLIMPTMLIQLRLSIPNYGGSLRNMKIWDVTLYNGESYILMLRIWRLMPFIHHFTVQISTNTYTDKERNVSFWPFEKEIKEYVDMGLLSIFYNKLTCPHPHPWGYVWCLDANARLHLFENWKTLNPQYGDYILNCDLDEIPTRNGMRYMIEHPPEDYYSMWGINTNPNFMFEADDCYTNTFIKYTPETHEFMWYRKAERRRKWPDFPIATHCSYCFNNYSLYINKQLAFAHTDQANHPFLNKSYLFRTHYCRHDIQRYYPMRPAKIFKDDTELAPPDPRFAYLLDPNFTLDITQTIYTEKDLPTLCNEENNWWIDPSKRILKPKWQYKPD